MLITRRDDRLVLVEQTAHARMAGELVAHWGNDTFAAPAPRDAVIAAAAKHDDGWAAADAEPLFNDDEARPLHFLEIPMREHIPLYARGVNSTFEHDPYAGMLVSMHWTGLYRGRWGMQEGRLDWAEDGRSEIELLQDEAVAGEEQRWIEVKRQLMREARRSDLEAGLWHNYDLLQAWDLLSLFICLIPLEPADGVAARPVPSTLKSLDQEPGVRTIESVPTRIGGERVDLTLRCVEPGVVAVDPYPFDEDGVAFSVTGTAIADRRYEDAADARAAIDAGDPVTIECRMTRP
jgi:hypothetical protein